MLGTTDEEFTAELHRRLNRYLSGAPILATRSAPAVVAEVLRLRPPVVDSVRLVRRDIVLGGGPVPAGTFLLAAPLLAHRDPTAYPDPWRFDPDRFLEHLPPHGAYLPFGGGSRRCLGAPLASLRLRVVLELAARTLRLQPASQPEQARLRGTAVVPGRGAGCVVESTGAR